MSNVTDQLFEQILENMKQWIRDWARANGMTVDTREGSIIHTTLAPGAVEGRLWRIAIEEIYKQMSPYTASRDFLIRHCRDRGIEVYLATQAVRLGEFSLPNIDTGARFRAEGLGGLIYRVLGPLEPPSPIAGQFRLICETPGEIGNTQTGNLLPIIHIEGLEWARLTDVLIPGQDEESTEHLRERFFESLLWEAFGGNIADYKKKVNSIPGVGGCKIYPAFADGWRYEDVLLPDNPSNKLELLDWIENRPGYAGTPDAPFDKWLDNIITMALPPRVLSVGGGRVRVVTIDSQYNPPTPTLIDDVQTRLDPEGNQGQGMGVAPIGHVVTSLGTTRFDIDVVTSLTFLPGYDWTAVQPWAISTINSYFAGLRAGWDKVDWENNPASTIIVHRAQIESRLLNLEGVLDIQNTTINGATGNISLNPDEVPFLGILTNV